MRTLKTIWITVIFILGITALANAQERINFGLYQDAKFAVIGDEARGYKAGTIDIVARFKMEGLQGKNGYVVVYPEFEYAEIKGTYKRYSVNVGYNFNQRWKNVEIQPSIGYGWIDRFGKTGFSFGGAVDVGYKVTDRLKLVAVMQATERKDLKIFYGENKLKFSGFIGIEFAIFGNIK